jgi:cell division protein FtsB
MGVTDRVWAALTSMIKLEDRVAQQSGALVAQQARIENLTERVIRLEAQLELLTSAAMVRKITRGKGPDQLT